MLTDASESFLAGANMVKMCHEQNFSSWYVTSAKSGSNVEAAFLDLVERAVQHGNNKVRQEWKDIPRRPVPCFTNDVPVIYNHPIAMMMMMMDGQDEQASAADNSGTSTTAAGGFKLSSRHQVPDPRHKSGGAWSMC